ncbi:MAG: hypothetical protein V7720_06020 [Halioglobus sp.]
MQFFIDRRLVLACLALLAPMRVFAGEYAADEKDYCSQAQQIIAATDLEPEVVLHDDYEAFVESKPTDQPFVIHRYNSAPVASRPEITTVVSCKLRTSERINTAHDSEGGAVPIAGAETSCDEVHRQVLAQIVAAVPKSARKLDLGDFVVEPEDMKFIGPQWLEPWPFTPATLDENALYHLHTRALYAPHAWWIPMPERFMGNYYCHLASPEYLEALVRGTVRFE